MNFQIKISIQDDIDLTVSLNESQTSKLIWNSLPIEGAVQVWGKEIYFATTVYAEPEKCASDIVEKGAVAYWPPGQALCLFYGPTPANEQGEIRAASVVNLLGYINESIEILNRVKPGDKIVIEKTDENLR